MALAVCEVDGSADMPKITDPWLLGRIYTYDGKKTEDKAVFASKAGMYKAGTGNLMYDDHARRWTGVWGSYWVEHSASTMISKGADCGGDELPKLKSGAVPLPGVKDRAQTSNTHDWNFCGGHESRVASRYHPGTTTIGTFCQNEKSDYHFKIGSGGPRHSVEHRYAYAGGIRPCCDNKGKAWIVAFGSDQETAKCMRLNDDGNSNTVSKQSPVELSTEKIDKRSVKIGTLGGSEATASCGRFLIGWRTKDNKWKLAEVDGNCVLQSGFPIDVTDSTKWDTQAEWSTTHDGKVTWVHAWDEESDGTPKQSCPYGAKPRKGRKDWDGNLGYDGYDFTTGFVTNEARISIYTTSANVPPPPSSCAIPAATGSGPRVCGTTLS